jgi:tRNA 2-thiouridine synthesizing protein E
LPSLNEFPDPSGRQPGPALPAARSARTKETTINRGAQMAFIETATKKIELDDDGFMLNMENWDQEVARELAHREGYDSLDEQQLEIISFMRDYYKKFSAFPMLNYVCKNLNQPKKCVNEEFINPMKAWKIAGLPKPDGIQFEAVDGKHYIMQECC